MRVCLVSNLNLSSWYSQDCEPAMVSLPLGLLSLAAVVRPDHTVAIVDPNYALAEGELELDDGFFGAVVDQIAAHAPDVVGFSTMCNSYHIALRLAETLKARAPHLPVVFGGPQASVVDVETLKAFPAVDMVLRGEAERTLPQLLHALEGHGELTQVPGLTCRTEGGIHRGPEAALVADLDALPVPAYDLFPYDVGGAPSIDVGRGCPFACSFCSTSTYWRRRFRMKSVGRIVDEMRMLRDTYGATHFTFMHDLFTVDRDRLERFCAAVIAETMDITWSCSARIDCVDGDLLKTMSEAGCRAIFYGIETGSPRMQREINKNLKLDQVRAVVDATLEARMAPTASFIAGFPTEAEVDLGQTMDTIEALLRRPEVSVQLHTLAPQNATPDYARYADRLRFDGYTSDIAGADYRFLEPEWFVEHPALFSSFYHYQTDGLRRDLVRGLDLFVHGPCAAMRQTVLQGLDNELGLWQLYLMWRQWADALHRGGGPMAGQSLDDYLLDFYDFVTALVAEGRCDIDLGQARDEVLAFYLQYYGQAPVRIVPVAEGTVTEQPAPSATPRQSG